MKNLSITRLLSRIFFFGCCILLPFFVSSCSSTKQFPVESFVVEGKVQYANIETGCWLLESDGDFQGKGKKAKQFLLLLGNDDVLNAIKKDGLKVKIRVQLKKNFTTTCMMGIPAEVLDVLESEAR